MVYKQISFWIASLIFSTSVASFDCTKILTGTVSSGATVSGTYDLCNFVIGPENKDGWYEAYDNRTVGNVELYGGDAVNYTFYFNIAANIAKPTPDPECDNYNRTYREIHGLEIGYCKDIVSAGMMNATCRNPSKNIVPIQQMTAAYQVHKHDNMCWRMHDGITAPIWTFLDANDPALGVQLTYINGDWCQPFGKNREFKIKFICSNDIKITPDYIETVFEPIDSGCLYEFEMKTYKGCPIECPVYNDALCSGHGVCDYDWNIAAPKCFCYCGWDGDACSIAINEVCDHKPDNDTGSSSGVAYNGCQFELTDTNGMTAEYDLSYFHLNRDVFRVIDANNAYFEYVFNICGAIDPYVMINNRTIPLVCSHPNNNHGPCIETRQLRNSTVPVCYRYEHTEGKTPSALQIDTYSNWTQCYWLGMEVPLADGMPEYRMELLNRNDAGKGVIFTIFNGEWCPSVGRNRQLRIKLECPDDNRIEFEPGLHQTQINSGVVAEIDTCVYELSVVSPNACPNACISRMNLEKFAVCGTHGICAADPYANGTSNYPNGTVRCLCDEGYTGSICQDVSQAQTPTNEISNRPTQSPLQPGQTHSPTTNHKPTQFPLQSGQTYSPTRSPLKPGQTYSPTNNPNQQSANSNKSQKTDSHMIVIGILVGAVVVLISIVLFCVYQHRKNKRLISDFVLMQGENQQSSIN